MIPYYYSHALIYLDFLKIIQEIILKSWNINILLVN